MKTWGQGGRGALLIVLLLLVSGAVLPLGALAQGKSIFAFVSDCASGSEVVAEVTLADTRAVFPDWIRMTTFIGFVQFSQPQLQPGYYKLKIAPSGFTHYEKEVGPYRFDGTQTIDASTCVDVIPPKNRWLNLTFVEAQPQREDGEGVTFPETQRGNENITSPSSDVDFDRMSGIVSLDFAPLVWKSENLLWENSSRIGEILQRGVHYDYSVNQSFNGKIQIIDSTIWNQLNHTVLVQADKGFLNVVSYRTASKSARLAHGQTANEEFFLNGTTPLLPYTDWIDYESATGALTMTADWAFGYFDLVAAYDWAGAISGVKVTIKDTSLRAVADSPPPTGSDGKISARIPSIALEVKAEVTLYQPQVLTFFAVGNIDQRVVMIKGWVVRVPVVNEDGDPILIANDLTGALIARGAAPNELRVLSPQVQDAQLRFFAFNLDWQVVVDAKGYAASTRNITVAGANVTLSPPVVLKLATEEKYVTEIAFRGLTDWGNLSIWRNVSFLPDSEIPWIRFTGLRNLTRQIDLAFGDGNTILTTLELDAFQADMVSRGPYYTDTVGFFTVNGKAYRSSPVGYTVSRSNFGGGLTFHTQASYSLVDATKPIAANQPKYFVNVTTIADKNVTQYQNYSFLVRLPYKYEMTSRTLQGNVTTRNFTNVTVDPGIDGGPSPRANMIVEFSLTGVARAVVQGPVGKISVRDANPASYLAWVANDTAIVFSANDSTDRHNQQIDKVNIEDANFTWRFLQDNATDITPVSGVFGIWTTFKFPTPPGGANYTVHLTVTQVNVANVTQDWINVTVDNVDPVASFTTNRTGATINPTSLPVNEDLFTEFRGAGSTDILWGTLAGKIAQWEWDFDSDGTVDKRGQTVQYNYSKPGRYVMNLTVIDFVGHKSQNKTMNVTVNDVTPPQISFVILDPNNSWRQTPTLTEGKMYFFNASATNDNSLNKTEDNVNLSYRWKWGVGEGQNGSDLGIRDPLNKGLLNVSHVYTKWGDYKLEVTVWDASDKNATSTRNPLTVQANVSAHPNVSIRANTLKVDPASPEEGGQVIFTFNITNAKGSANATSLRAMLAIRERNEDKNQSTSNFTVEYLRDGAVVTNPVLVAEQNLTVKIVWHAPNKVGNHSLRITVYDEDEPKPWVDAGNRQDTSLLVKEAGWKFWAIVGGFLFVIFGLPILYYVVRKFRAGEWQMRRRRREEGEEDEEEEEEDEDEEDEDEEEERGGKKRL